MDFLTEKELAERLKRPIRTIRDWRAKRILPYYRIGRSVVYSESRVLEAIKKLERNVEAVA